MKREESKISEVIAQMKEFEREKAQEKLDTDEDKRFLEARGKARVETKETPVEKKQSREKKELIRHVKDRVAIIMERVSVALARTKFQKGKTRESSAEQKTPEAPRYISYEERQEAIRVRYQWLCDIGSLKREEGITPYAMEWRLEGYYRKKADFYSKKTGKEIRDFSIPTEEEMVLLDREVSDEEMLLALADKQEQRAREREQRKIEEAREEVMRRASELDKYISYASREYQEAVGYHEQRQPYLYESARISAENRIRYEHLREKEIQGLEKIEAILAKRTADEAARAAAVYFDSHLDIHRLRKTGVHFDYGFARTETGYSTYNMDRLPPVMAIAPARLLEAHSVTT